MQTSTQRRPGQKISNFIVEHRCWFQGRTCRVASLIRDVGPPAQTRAAAGHSHLSPSTAQNLSCDLLAPGDLLAQETCLDQGGDQQPVSSLKPR
jgi:hypothetical protein